MDFIQHLVEQYLKVVNVHVPSMSIPIGINVHGCVVQARAVGMNNTEYWVRHVRETVLFNDALILITDSMKGESRPTVC